MDPVSTLLYQYGTPTGTSLKPVESFKPILAPGYELWATPAVSQYGSESTFF
jgi:hypothetical protein